ncbi:MAG: hypothetical protein IJZ19_06425 [Lentisphaeria bacterium]|nr:hypothetical protein [Lentisphaeria bacterium]
MKYSVMKDMMEIKKNGHRYNDGKYQLEMISFENDNPDRIGEFDDLEAAREFAKKQKMIQQDLGSNLMRYEFVYIAENDEDGEPTYECWNLYVPGLHIATACRENGDIIDLFDSEEAAESAIAEYEEEDRQNGEFEENFYEVKKLF